MAQSPKVRQMRNLRDRGLSVRKIAHEMGVKPESVRRTVSLYSAGLGPDSAYRKAMERSSRQLLAAIRIERGAA